ncbi:P-loop containing nucleoside triphosphate hydrolase protein [Cristinia sonorae]|uniref:P-loop containing nucleoside triphosphate hydrolase protein n=1 Tax=Cristinia sonorae TaxID=1940300 RepID=A0A8K0V0E5_9AGAR|nr:P-loop containing nucleoside triphosphate hydrolase protein [Cristinia sonorae]
MTSLRTFQNEIDEIRHREVVKQRAAGHATLEREKDKEHKKPSVGSKGVDSDEKATVKDAPAVKAHAVLDTDDELGKTEEEIQTCLLSGTQTNHDRARDMVASILTRGRGEHIFRIGARPLHTKLFSGEEITAGDKDGGISRTVEELDILRERITEIVDEVGGKTTVLFEERIVLPRITLLLRLPPPSVALTPEVRCAVVGNVDSGKSTTLGVLTRGALDDGRGRARVSLFRHKHEIESGRTSSVGMEILGFGPSGAPILPSTSHSNDPDVLRREKMSWEDISLQASKIVSFSDLAGHERYLKTTLYGLTSGSPSCVILIVGGNAGLIGMSKEHLAIALALSVPVVVCITKVDMTPANVLAETIKQVTKILKSPGCRKTPVFVKSMEIAVEISQTFAKQRLCPIIQLSNVTGEGLDYVRTFLNLLPASEGDTEKFMVDQPLEYCVTEVWSVPYVGTVVDGILNAGRVKAGDNILIGPDSNGNFQPTSIKSIQRKRAPVNSAEAGQCVSLALKRMRRAAVRKGMVIVHKIDAGPPRAVRQFEGQVLILYHNTTLQRNYQAMLHCGAIRQTVRIIGMDHPQGILRTGDRATVTFEFISQPEYIKEGMKLLFREGKTKGLGVITRIL